jgi:hypothetical protein
MSSETFFQRLGSLIQKSRKAQRLYANMGRSAADNSPFSESQIEEWRSITSSLLKQLMLIWERPHTAGLQRDAALIADNFRQIWRASETDLHRTQKELIAASERGDYTRVLSLAEMGITLKARVQASHAAYHELSEIVGDYDFGVQGDDASLVDTGQRGGADESVFLAVRRRSEELRVKHQIAEHKSYGQPLSDGIVPLVDKAIDQLDRTEKEVPSLAKIIPLRKVSQG